LESLLIEAFGSVFTAELCQPILHRFIFVLELPYFLFELSQLVLLSFEQFFRCCNAFDLVLFFLPRKRVQLALVYFYELVDIVQFFFDQLELLVQVRRISFVGLRELRLVKNFIDCFAQLI
jgi:hypothetical protein